MRIPEGGSHLPTEVLNDAKIKLSSVMKNQRPYSGLSREQEEKYLPEVIGISPDDSDFSGQVRKYWAELTVNVPQEGHQLQVPVFSDGGEPDPKGIHVEDWIIYQWAKNHPMVADTREKAEANINKRFFIYDPEVETQRQNRSAKVKKKAYREFIKLSEKPNKMALLVRVLTDQTPDRMSNMEIENSLSTQVDNDPERFIRAATDKNLEIKGQIMDAVQSNVLQKIGRQYMYNDEVIGDTQDEVVAWWKNKRNSKVVQEIKAKTKEANR